MRAGPRPLHVPIAASAAGPKHDSTSYWSNEHIDHLRERGIIPLIAADAH
jgi:hypothetical protein